MTTRNAGEYLSVAVESIRVQRLTDWRLVLVDNASTDGSVDALDLSDPRIHLVQLSRDIGRTEALRTALHLVDTPFTAVLDADDIAREDRLAKQVHLLETRSDLVLVGSRVDRIPPDPVSRGVGSNLGGLVSHDQLAERNVFAHSSLTFRTDAARRVGGYDARFAYAQDYDLIMRLATQGLCFMLDEPLVTIRIHGASATSSLETTSIRIHDEATLFALAPVRLTLTARGRRLNRRRRAIVGLERSMHEFRRRNFGAGLRSALASVATDPSLSWIFYLVGGRPTPRFRTQSTLDADA